MKKDRFFSAKNIAFLAVLLALVVVLQLWGSAIPIGPVNMNLTLIPIVLGAVLLGAPAGAFLGLASGIVVLANGIAGVDVFTNFLFGEQPIFTAFLCLFKGTAAGFVSGLLYRWIASKNRYAAVLVAGLTAPVVNTGIFVVGALLMSGTIAGFMASQEISGSVVYFVVIVLAGLNFLVEFAINAVFAPGLYRIAEIVGRTRGKRGKTAERNAKPAENPPKAVTQK